MKTTRIITTIFMTIMLAFTTTFTYAESPAYTSRSDIPSEYKWNLQTLYKNETQWKQDVYKAKKLADRFAKKEEKLDSDKQILHLLEDYFELFRLMEKIFVYSRINLDVDIGNTSAQALSDEGQNMMMYVVERTAWFSNELQAIDKDKWDSLMESPKLKPYYNHLKDTYEEKIHSLPPDMEKILIKTMPFVNAPSELFKMMSKDLVLPNFTVRDKVYEMSAPLYSVYMSSKDREVRKAAFQTYYHTLENYQDTFASMLANIVKANNFFATTRNYPSSLEAHLEGKDIDPKVYTQLIETVEEGLPILQRYLQLKEKYVGIDAMHMYDLSAPSPYTPEEKIPYEEAKDIVIKGLSPIGETYLKTLSEGLSSNWVDVYNTPGKATGAYQIGSYDSHPFVLLNYQGLPSDVLTLAHEMGHAMHSYFSNKNQPYQDARYVTFTAEVSSTLQEHLLHKQLMDEASTKEEKLHALYQYLEDFRVTLFRQTQFAEFEKIIHEMGQNEESLHADAIKSVYFDLNKKYYGKSIEVDKEIAMEWARVPHFFHSSFYTYQYATSFAASAALAEQLEAGGAEAQNKILKELFSSGGSLPPIELLKRAGVDMSKKEPIVESLKRYEELVNEFEELLNNG
ncbi:oligoendopeptidase F [Sutcliffiella horikoshii]|uniref:oligoendopeptidase F n=1 Tax=Sutcliffiella horikoshii TaxID=79883 RepID=UPI001EEEDE0E|nr:oligoendopeptidase F [Sutcliffiella horikoshii]MCG1022824.1 oligoendopeptidase F [Sutcliffiella horikoshii]